MLLRIALRKNRLKLTALMTATALAVGPMAAVAQENKGPPVIRDTETGRELAMMRWSMPPRRTTSGSVAMGHIVDCVVVRLSRYWK